MPRNCTLVSVPSAIEGRLTTCDSSAEISGLPSAPLATPGRVLTSGTWLRVMTELVSACEPPRSTSAVLSSPVPLRVALKPSPIASIATSTPTTPAMPTMITDEAPQRCGRLAMPMRAAASASRPLRVSTSHSASTTATASTPCQGRAIQAPSAAISSTVLNRFQSLVFISASP